MLFLKIMHVKFLNFYSEKSKNFEKNYIIILDKSFKMRV